MKKLILVLAVLALAAPALAGNPTVKAVIDGDLKVAIVYDVNEVPDGNLFRAFALTVSVDSGATIGTPNNLDPNFYIYPGSISIIGGDVDDYGTAVAAQDSTSFTVEMGSLYASNDPCGHLTAPAKTGVLCKFTVDKGCTVSLAADGTRGGIVMEDTEGIFTVDLYGVVVPGGGSCYPICWDEVSQCYGDTDDNQNVGLTDFYAFQASWDKCTPHVDYDPNADPDRDGCVGLTDFYVFQANWDQGVGSDCVAGDPCDVFPCE